MTKKVDLIYIEGPEDIVEAFARWKNQEDVLTETSITFIIQMFDFCKANQLKSIFISTHTKKKQAEHLDLIAKNIPKMRFSGGIGYHLGQLLYGLQILVIALRYRPQYLHITSEVTHWFMLAPLKFLGIKIFPQFHNTLWPIGFPPKGGFKRFILFLDGWFLRRIASVAFCVSLGVKQQLVEITHNKISLPIYLHHNSVEVVLQIHPKPQPITKKLSMSCLQNELKKIRGFLTFLIWLKH